MITDWKIHIEEGAGKEPTLNVVPAVEDEYQVVFINCATWEQAQTLRDRFLDQEQ